ncbi:hypothetical protein [Pandoraea sp. ISTKB]|uniref:hypothetical protein n=1 Tax=Pandoraea sp. ISTKB TaxID=1586708 RepID=UPI0008478859|nr:hypothetical protein [Pandoraea sp. ISTKB]ODP35212.1 hypothetical protein A9762_11000 [Pandoraea sp. ISTKB]
MSETAPGTAQSETMLLTVFLRHDQSNNLDDFQERLKAAEWWERFPPAGVKVVSWTVAMSFGQIVTLELLPHLLPAVNVELERSAWGVFRTECYPTYDFVPVHARIRERVRNGGK